MSSNLQIPLPQTPRLAFADLHNPEEITDFTLEINGNGEQARSGISTIPPPTHLDAAAPAFVPAGEPTSSLNPQATTFQPRLLPHHQQHTTIPPTNPDSTMTVQATAFFRSSSFQQLCGMAIQSALLPAANKPPTNYVVELTTLEPQYAALAKNLSAPFLGLASRRATPLEGSAISEAVAKHLAAIFATLARSRLPFSALSAVAKDTALPDLAATALQRVVSYSTGPPPNAWLAKDRGAPGLLHKEPLHPFWDGILERFRWAMLQLVWEERREWFTGNVAPAGVATAAIGEEELRRELERVIEGGQAFLLRGLRRGWVATLGQPVRE